MVNKLKTKSQILKVVNHHKKKKLKVAMVSGSFDLLHRGHIEYLRACKKQGDVLIVLLNSDKSIKGYKGPNRPIIDEKSRAITLSALSCVDHVFIFSDLTPLRYIEELKPDVYCNGSDWGKSFLERDPVLSYGGEIFLYKRIKGFSSSGIVSKIMQIESSPDVMAIFCFDRGLEKILKSYFKKYLVINIKNKNLLNIAKSKNISLARSFVVGQLLKEIETGKMHNTKTIFIGKKPKDITSTQYPDFIIKNAADIKKILK